MSTRRPRRDRPAGDTKSPKGRRRRRWRRLLLLLGVASIAVVAAIVYLFVTVPLPSKDPPLLQTTFVCAADVSSGCDGSNSMAQLSAGVDRVTVTYDKIPEVLIDGVISAEDRGFFKHGGVDPVGVGRAVWADLRSKGSRQGGSTITQQYVKNVYLTNERSLTRKVKEAVLAVKLERSLPKTEILNRYLNTIYFGRGAYGVQAASRTYFGKDVQDLTLPEAALLAGLIRSPETADPGRAPTDPQAKSGRDTAIFRRTSVLDAMVHEHYVTQAQRDAAVATGFDDVLPRQDVQKLGNVAHPELGTEYVVDYVRQTLVTSGQFTEAQVTGGGLRVYTSLDYDLQRDAVDAIASTMDKPGDPSSSLVAIDTDGHVKVLVGGRDYAKSKVNLAVGTDGGGSGRQAGSTFKTFAVAEALKQGMTLDKTYNSPGHLDIPNPSGGPPWSVDNDDKKSYGTIPMTTATKDSVNTYFAQLAVEINPENLAAMATRMGVTSPLTVDPTLVLGTSSVSTLDMASAYSTLMDNGEHVTPTLITKVTDAAGKVLYQAPTHRDRVLTQDITDQVSWDLSQVLTPGGTGAGANFGQPAAGKTGTTSNAVDAWFVGYTCKLTAATWMGYSDGEIPMTDVHGREVFGGTFPATIWSKFMAKATQGLDSCPFNRPAPKDNGGTPRTTFRSRSTSTTDAPAPTTTTTAPVESTTTEAPSTTVTTVARSTTTVPPPTTTRSTIRAG